MGSRSASKVPVKRGNGRGTPWREEWHRGTEPLEGKAARTPLRETVSTQLRRIASCGEPVTLRSRMRQRARPDLWEAWVGDHPGPPGAPLGAARARMEASPRARPSASTGAAADPGCSTDT